MTYLSLEALAAAAAKSQLQKPICFPLNIVHTSSHIHIHTSIIAVIVVDICCVCFSLFFFLFLCVVVFFFLMSDLVVGSCSVAAAAAAAVECEADDSTFQLLLSSLSPAQPKQKILEWLYLYVAHHGAQQIMKGKTNRQGNRESYIYI